MKSWSRVAIALGLTLAGLGVLQAAEQAYKCTMELQVCLNEMVSALKKRGWVGIEYDDSTSGKPMRIYRVVPGSPAEAAGLLAGDILLAMDGLRFDNSAVRDKIAERRAKQAPNTNVQYTVQRGGKERVITITLGALPSDVMAQWIGMHMLEHAQVEPAR